MKTQRTWVFSPLDLIMPIGVGLLAVSLCVLSFFKAEVAPAKLVSVIAGAFFLASVPIWYVVRSIKRKFHLQVAGMYIVYGRLNKPNMYILEAWVNDLVKQWQTARWCRDAKPVTLSPDMIETALEGITVFFVDDEKLSILGRFVRGYSWGLDCVVGFRLGHQSYTESLFKHEVSHQIIGRTGEPWDEKRHHAIFKITDLNA